MVSLLGATGGATFVALTPVVTGLMAIPVLGEWPVATDWVAIVLISVGVYVVSGGAAVSLEDLANETVRFMIRLRPMPVV